MKTRRQVHFVLGLLVLVGLSGCSRDNRFLYPKKPDLVEPFPGHDQQTITMPAPSPSPWPSTSPSPGLPFATVPVAAHVEFASAESASRPLDVLFVIDNSGSMGDKQKAVLDNAASFIQTFAATQNKIDWRMGLISTSLAENPYVGFAVGDELDFKTVDPVGKFQTAVSKLGTSGDSTERTFEPVLKVATNYPKFFRKDSVMALIVLTDEEEQSTITPAGFINSFAPFKAVKDIQMHGIFASREDMCNGFDYFGSVYEQYMNVLNGTRYSLCADFGTTLAQIGTTITIAVAKNVIRLAQRPVLSTIHVFYRGVEIPGGSAAIGGYWRYDYDANMIIFHDTSFVDVSDLFIDVKYEVKK